MKKDTGLKAIVSSGYSTNPIPADFNAVKHVEPFARKIVFERLNPRKIVKDISSFTRELGLLFHDIPSEFRELQKQIKRGNLKITFDHLLLYFQKFRRFGKEFLYLG